MILREEISKIAEIKANELNGYIVDVTVNTSNDIVVYFDSKEGVKINQCVSISRFINENFDREVQDYSLTVCSPGLTSPFKVKNQYINNQGKEILSKFNWKTLSQVKTNIGSFKFFNNVLNKNHEFPLLLVLFINLN